MVLEVLEIPNQLRDFLGLRSTSPHCVTWCVADVQALVELKHPAERVIQVGCAKLTKRDVLLAFVVYWWKHSTLLTSFKSESNIKRRILEQAASSKPALCLALGLADVQRPWFEKCRVPGTHSHHWAQRPSLCPETKYWRMDVIYWTSYQHGPWYRKVVSARQHMMSWCLSKQETKVM